MCKPGTEMGELLDMDQKHWVMVNSMDVGEDVTSRKTPVNRL
jgi:hypothetical protein